MYTISYTSQLLDIPAVTIRAWETRYHAVIPVRTEAGYRLFSDQDIEDLRWLKIKVNEEGMNISQAATQLRQYREKCVKVAADQAERAHGAELEEQLEAHHVSEEKQQVENSYPTDIHSATMERLYMKLCAYQTAKAKSELDVGFSMFGYEATICRVLIPMMLKVGSDWEEGRISIAQEHFITEFVSQRCYGFFQSFPIDDRMPRALAFCPSGELHHVGLLLFSLFLRSKGLDVIYLGPNTPEDGIEDIVRERDIEMVSISLNDPELLPNALKIIDCLQMSFPNLVFAFGGKGFSGMDEPYNRWLLPGGASEGWGPWFDTMIKAYDGSGIKSVS